MPPVSEQCLWAAVKVSRKKCCCNVPWYKMSQTGTIPMNAPYLPVSSRLREKRVRFSSCLFWVTSDHYPRWESQSCMWCSRDVTCLQVCWWGFRCWRTSTWSRGRKCCGGWRSLLTSSSSSLVFSSTSSTQAFPIQTCDLAAPCQNTEAQSEVITFTKCFHAINRVCVPYYFLYTVICCFQSIKIVYATQTKDVTSPVACTLFYCIYYFYLFYKFCFWFFLTKG